MKTQPPMPPKATPPTPKIEKPAAAKPAKSGGRIGNLGAWAHPPKGKK